MSSRRFLYVLSLADDALVLSQRLAEWCSHAPEIEEDIALANIALDLLGQARNLLSYASVLQGEGRDEDELAYLRNEREFRNVLLVEHENGDFAMTITRQFLFSAYQLDLYRLLALTEDTVIVGIAAKAAKEVAYHVEHSREWMLRLGDGTEESHRRAQRALDELWPYTHELFEPDDAALVPPPTLRAPWLASVTGLFREAGLVQPADAWRPTGGRVGRHTEMMGHLLAELQHLHRSHPGVAW